MNKHTQRGAVFIYILMAVALFAALTYAVSRGNRGGTSTLTDQQAKLAAQEIIDYGNTVANAVQKLRLRGCTDTEISFENNTYAGYINAGAPTDKSCHVFDVNGGNIQYAKSPEPYFFPSNPIWRRSYGFMRGTEWQGYGTTCGAAECSDLVMILSPLDENLCLQLNKLVGITGSVPEESIIGGTNFTGTYDFQENFGDEALSAVGKQGACVKATNTGLYSFLQILLAR